MYFKIIETQTIDVTRKSNYCGLSKESLQKIMIRNTTRNRKTVK